MYLELHTYDFVIPKLPKNTSTLMIQVGLIATSYLWGTVVMQGTDNSQTQTIPGVSGENPAS